MVVKTYVLKGKEVDPWTYLKAKDSKSLLDKVLNRKGGETHLIRLGKEDIPYNMDFGDNMPMIELAKLDKNGMEHLCHYLLNEEGLWRKLLYGDATVWQLESGDSDQEWVADVRFHKRIKDGSMAKYFRYGNKITLVARKKGSPVFPDYKVGVRYVNPTLRDPGDSDKSFNFNAAPPNYPSAEAKRPTKESKKWLAAYPDLPESLALSLPPMPNMAQEQIQILKTVYPKGIEEMINQRRIREWNKALVRPLNRAQVEFLIHHKADRYRGGEWNESVRKAVRALLANGLVRPQAIEYFKNFSNEKTHIEQQASRGPRIPINVNNGRVTYMKDGVEHDVFGDAPTQMARQDSGSPPPEMNPPQTKRAVVNKTDWRATDEAVQKQESQCCGITKDGKRCRKAARPHMFLCSIHAHAASKPHPLAVMTDGKIWCLEYLGVTLSRSRHGEDLNEAMAFVANEKEGKSKPKPKPKAKTKTKTQRKPKKAAVSHKSNQEALAAKQPKRKVAVEQYPPEQDLVDPDTGEVTRVSKVSVKQQARDLLR